MSIDNGIYILKTKDHQYRITCMSNVDYLHYSYIDDKYWDKKFVPSRIVEIFGDLRFTRNEYKAFQIAHKWEKSLPKCEYGINLLTYNKTWKQILIDAVDYAKKEWESFDLAEPLLISDDYDYILCKIANGYYLDKWLKREKYYKELKEKVGVKDAV